MNDPDGQRIPVPQQPQRPSIFADLLALDWLAIGIIAFSLVFRLALYDNARFAGDEAMQYGIAKSVGDLQFFPVQGSLTTLAVNAHIPGGAYFWILGIPLLVFHSPEACMTLIVLLSVAGLALGYRLLRREYGAPAAIGGLLLAAFNPFNLFHSDRIWNPNLLLPIGFLFLILLLDAMRGQKRWSTFWLGALLIAAPQIHLSVSLLIALIGILLVVVRPAGFRWRQFLFGCAAGAATYLPYIIVEVLNGFANTRLLFGSVASSSAPVIEALRAVYYMVLYAGGDMTYYVAKGSAFPMTEWGFLQGDGLRLMAEFMEWDRLSGFLLTAGIAVGVLVSLVATLALLGGTFVSLVQKGRDAVRQNPLAFLVMVNLPLVAALFWGRKLFFPHYTIVVFPLALVPIAWGVSRIRSARLQGAVLVVLALIAVSQGVLSARYYLREEARTSVPVFREVARAILDDSPGRPVAFECDLPRTQCGSYPAHVIADRELGRDFPENGAAQRRYIMSLPGEQYAKGAVRVWDLGPIWLVRKDRP